MGKSRPPGRLERDVQAVFYVHGAERNMPAKAAPPRHGGQGKSRPYPIVHGAERNMSAKAAPPRHGGQGEPPLLNCMKAKHYHI